MTPSTKLCLIRFQSTNCRIVLTRKKIEFNNFDIFRKIMHMPRIQRWHFHFTFKEPMCRHIFHSFQWHAWYVWNWIVLKCIFPQISFFFLNSFINMDRDKKKCHSSKILEDLNFLFEIAEFSRIWKNIYLNPDLEHTRERSARSGTTCSFLIGFKSFYSL